MPAIAAKNRSLSLSPAAADLGMGDMLAEQLAADEEERKKKLQGGAGKSSLPGVYGDSTMGLASMNLLGQ